MLSMAEKCNPMRQHLSTNYQRLRCVTSTFGFKLRNSELLGRFRGTQQFLLVECTIYAPTAPNGPTPHHFEITLRHTTVFRTTLEERSAPDNTQHSQETRIHAPGRDSNPQSQEASGRRPTPRPCDHRH